MTEGNEDLEPPEPGRSGTGPPTSRRLPTSMPAVVPGVLAVALVVWVLVGELTENHTLRSDGWSDLLVITAAALLGVVAFQRRDDTGVALRTHRALEQARLTARRAAQPETNTERLVDEAIDAASPKWS